MGLGGWEGGDWEVSGGEARAESEGENKRGGKGGKGGKGGVSLNRPIVKGGGVIEEGGSAT